MISPGPCNQPGKLFEKPVVWTNLAPLGTARFHNSIKRFVRHPPGLFSRSPNNSVTATPHYNSPRAKLLFSYKAVFVTPSSNLKRKATPSFPTSPSSGWTPLSRGSDGRFGLRRFRAKTLTSERNTSLAHAVRCYGTYTPSPGAEIWARSLRRYLTLGETGLDPGDQCFALNAAAPLQAHRPAEVTLSR
jgi:hypothetical protein